MDFEDQGLTREILAGSDLAFERLMLRYRRLVYRVAYGFTRDREGAMEVTQDTFLQVHARLGSWRGEGELKNWIARIAANRAMTWSRRERLHPTCELDESAFLRPDPSQEEELHEREILGALHRSLSTLSPRQRLAIVLRYFQELPILEIAAVLECSEGTARNILFRSLRKLRSVMAQPEEALP